MKFLFFMLLCQCWQHTVNGNQEWVPYITDEEFAAVQGMSIPVSNYSHGSFPVMSTGEIQSHQARPGFGSALWPRACVPYVLDPSLTSDDRKQVALAMQEYMDKTCIRFISKSPIDDSWIRIVRDSDPNTCSSSQPCMPSSGESIVKFGGSCVNAEVMVREFGHTLCMGNEQSRQDRDDWITFDTTKCTADPKDGYTLGLNKLYDYVSVEHDEQKCYSGCIVPKQAGVTKCGSGGPLSVLDVEILNEVYGCTAGCNGLRWANVATGLDMAVVSGAEKQGQPLNTCRFYFHGDILPGKYFDGYKSCYAPWGGQERETNGQYMEILKNPNGATLTWVKGTSGSSGIPSNAVKGGRSNEREPLYVVKCLLNISGQILETPGKFHGATAYASYRGNEVNCGNDFYFLTCS